MFIYSNYQLAPAATTGILDLTNTTTYGKCNVVYVGVVVTKAQKAQLQDYSRTFKVPHTARVGFLLIFIFVNITRTYDTYMYN